MSAQEGKGSRLGETVKGGALLGLGFGVLEVMALIFWGRSVVDRHYLLEGAILYSVAGALLAFLAGAVSRISRRPLGKNGVIALLLGAFLFLMGGGYASVYLLPERTNPRTLITLCLILLGSVGVAYGLYRTLENHRRRRRPTVRERPVFRWLPRLGLIGLCLAVVIGSLLPSGWGRGGRGGVPSADKAGSSSSISNIVLLVIDALRRDHMSIYGYERETTPNIDAWAKTGVIFDRAVAASSWTLPSMVSLFTSVYPSTHGAVLPSFAVPDEIGVLPQYMRDRGLRTGVFSANHFVTPMYGFDRGVDHFYARTTPRLGHLMLGRCLISLREWMPPLAGSIDLIVRLEQLLLGEKVRPEDLRAEGLTRSFWRWLDGLDGEPFFAYLHFMEPHTPYHPPPDYVAAFLPERLSGSAPVEAFPSGDARFPFERGPAYSLDSLELGVSLYDGEILYADHWIGRLIDDLRGRGLYQKTIVILTADHGEEFYDHYGWDHGHTLFQEMIHVPLVMSLPLGGGDQGTRSGALVRHIDILPTLLELMGSPLPAGLAGRSLLPLLQGKDAPDLRPLSFSELSGVGYNVSALRRGDRKVIRCFREGETILMAFDLDADPLERQNLIETDADWPIAMLTRLEDIHQAALEEASVAKEVAFTDEDRRRMRALGYLK